MLIRHALEKIIDKNVKPIWQTYRSGCYCNGHTYYFIYEKPFFKDVIKDTLLRSHFKFNDFKEFKSSIKEKLNKTHTMKSADDSFKHLRGYVDIDNFTKEDIIKIEEFLLKDKVTDTIFNDDYYIFILKK